MAEPDADTRPKAESAAAIPTLAEMQHWTWVMGRAQQLMMEHVAKGWGEAPPMKAADPKAFAQWPGMNLFADPGRIAKAQADMWSEGLAIWQRALGGDAGPSEIEEKAARDKRFAASQWRENPLFDMIRQT